MPGCPAHGRVGYKSAYDKFYLYFVVGIILLVVSSMRLVRATPLLQHIPRMLGLRECFQGSRLPWKKSSDGRVLSVHGGGAVPAPISVLVTLQGWALAGPPLCPAQSTPGGCRSAYSTATWACSFPSRRPSPIWNRSLCTYL